MKALFIVDVQNDFLPGGALAVPNGDEVISPINTLMAHFDLIWASKDWHPRQTTHFDKWPVHCVRGTWGAAFPDALNRSGIQKVFLKGTGTADDGYSAFEATNEDLLHALHYHGVTALYVTGLATDYCVLATARDAARMGLPTYVVREAIRAVNLHPGDEEKALQEMKEAGVSIISMNEISQMHL